MIFGAKSRTRSRQPLANNTHSERASLKIDTRRRLTVVSDWFQSCLASCSNAGIRYTACFSFSAVRSRMRSSLSHVSLNVLPESTLSTTVTGTTLRCRVLDFCTSNNRSVTPTWQKNCHTSLFWRRAAGQSHAGPTSSWSRDTCTESFPARSIMALEIQVQVCWLLCSVALVRPKSSDVER